ncbi:MAG: hypothetical protein ABIH23_27600, partial [bacterium]
MSQQRTFPNQSVELGASVLELIQDAAFLCDEHSTILAMNQTAQDLYGDLFKTESKPSLNNLFGQPEELRTLLDQALQSKNTLVSGELIT